MCVWGRERKREREMEMERYEKGSLGSEWLIHFSFGQENRTAGARKDEQVTARTRRCWGGGGLFTFDLARRRAQDGAFPRDIEVGFDRHDCGRSVEVFGECWYG